MDAAVSAWSLALVTVTLAAAAVLAARPVAALMRAGREGRGPRIVWLLGAGLLAAVLFRPHEHQFQGLDCSAYRLMTRAFLQGRGFHDVDRTLASLPPSLRPAALLRTGGPIRPTRDRSFEIDSIETCATRPYFYPTLPLASAGLARLCGGSPGMADFFAPLLGWLLAAGLLAAAAVRTGSAGVLLALALWLASPLPSWTLRGCFAEAAGAALVGLGILACLGRNRPPAALPAFLCGLAVGYHPALLPLALTAAILAACPWSLRRTAAACGAFAAGLVPLLLLTLSVAQPYGMLRLDRQAVILRAAPIVAAVLAAAALVVLLPAVLLAARRPLSRVWQNLRARRPRLARALPLVAALVPAAAMLAGWRQAHWVMAGAASWVTAAGVPLTVLLAAVAVGAAWAGRPRPRLLALGLLALAPLYLALKGFEPVGFWSLRRLAPLLLLALVLAADRLAGRFSSWIARGRSARAWTGAALVGLAAAWSLCRQPDAYRMREESGADACVAELAARIGAGTVLCDYYPHSVPLAFVPGLNAIGVSRDWAAWVTWSRSEMQRGRTPAWLTSYEAPGVEDGIELAADGTVAIALPRLVASRDRRGRGETWRMRATVLRIRPASPDAPPVLDKRLDGGPLALRGAWDSRPRSLPGAGATLPARICRTGCGIVGPVPRSGGAVRATLIGAAAPGSVTPLRLRLPWGGESPVVDFTGSVSTNVLNVPRLVDGAASGATGCYGFEVGDGSDAAVVSLHRVRIEVLPPGDSA